MPLGYQEVGGGPLTRAGGKKKSFLQATSPFYREKGLGGMPNPWIRSKLPPGWGAMHKRKVQEILASRKRPVAPPHRWTPGGRVRFGADYGPDRSSRDTTKLTATTIEGTRELGRAGLKYGSSAGIFRRQRRREGGEARRLFGRGSR